MIRKKVCMLGAYAVGKTSLVARRVHRIFSDKYLSTVGVRIDKAPVAVDGRPVELLIWDLEGDDELAPFRQSYLRGAAGYILVSDGTRPATLDALETIQRNAAGVVGDVPFVAVVNKADMMPGHGAEGPAWDRLRARGWPVLVTSAKTGEGVDDLFATIAGALVPPSDA
jgi:hypothetical protein